MTPGVMFDLYLEDHEKTCEQEAKKEKKSLAKAFSKLDLAATGVCVCVCVCVCERERELDAAGGISWTRC